MLICQQETTESCKKAEHKKLFPIVIIWLASHVSVTNLFRLLWILSLEFQQLLYRRKHYSYMVFSRNISLGHRSKKYAIWQNADRKEYTISQQALC